DALVELALGDGGRGALHAGEWAHARPHQPPAQPDGSRQGPAGDGELDGEQAVQRGAGAAQGQSEDQLAAVAELAHAHTEPGAARLDRADGEVARRLRRRAGVATATG